MVETLFGWRSVPWYLMTATQLRELEFPRAATAEPVAEVVTSDWRDKRATFDLYDARLCPPTASRGRQLAAARSDSSQRPRRCGRCGARTQRPLTQLDGEPGPRCPLCRQLEEINRRQHALAAERPQHVARARELLALDQVAVLHAERVVPPPTPAGRARPATATRVHAVEASTGRRLVDVTARLVGERARFVPDHALAPEAAVACVHKALLHRPLIAWSRDHFAVLRELAGHPDLAHDFSAHPYSLAARKQRNHAAAIVDTLASRWRGQLDLDGQLVPCLSPGSPARLLLLLQRIADDEHDALDMATVEQSDAGMTSDAQAEAGPAV